MNQYDDDNFQLYEQPIKTKNKTPTISNSKIKQSNKKFSLPHVHTNSKQSDIDQIKQDKKIGFQKGRSQSKLSMNQSRKSLNSKHIQSSPNSKISNLRKKKSSKAFQTRKNQQKNIDLTKPQNKLAKSMTLNNSLLKNNKKVLTLRKQTQSQRIQQFLVYSDNQLQNMSFDQINRINNKMKEWIRHINQQLSMKINQRLMQQKKILNKKQKNSLDVQTQNMINVLSSDLEARESVYTTLQKQKKKIMKNSSIFTDDYDLVMQIQKEEIQNKIKKIVKSIHQLKKNVKLQSKRFVQTRDQIVQRGQGAINPYIANAKKQIWHNQSIIQQMDEKISSLEEKDYQIDQKYQKLMIQAKSKNIIQKQQQPLEKYQQLKAKIDKLQMICQNKKHVFQRDVDKNIMQIRNLRHQAKNYQRDVLVKQQKNQNIIQMSITLCEKANVQPSKVNLQQLSLFFKNQNQPKNSKLSLVTDMKKQDYGQNGGKKQKLKQINQQQKRQHAQKNKNKDKSPSKDDKQKRNNTKQSVQIKNSPSKVVDNKSNVNGDNQFMKQNNTSLQGIMINSRKQRNKIQTNNVVTSKQQKQTKKGPFQLQIAQDTTQGQSVTSDKPEEGGQIVAPRRFKFRKTNKKQQQFPS